MTSPLIEGVHGFCRVCGSPLLGVTLTILPAPWLGRHEASEHWLCGECNHHTPKPVGYWSPVNPDWDRDRHLLHGAETVKQRLDRMNAGQGPLL